jgi:hypothetical protein
VFVFEQGYAGTFLRASRAGTGSVINEATGAAFTCSFTYPDPQ